MLTNDPCSVECRFVGAFDRLPGQFCNCPIAWHSADSGWCASAAALHRGRWYVDGSLHDFVLWRNSDLLTCGGAAFVVDYSVVRASATSGL